MPEDGYTNLESAPLTGDEPPPPTLNDLRKGTHGLEYKEPEDLRQLVSDVSCKDLIDNGLILVFWKVIYNYPDEPEHGCAAFCRVAPGVWARVWEEGWPIIPADYDEFGAPQRSWDVLVLEMDEDFWLTHLALDDEQALTADSTTGMDVELQENDHKAVLSILDASGKKHEAAILSPTKLGDMKPLARPFQSKLLLETPIKHWQRVYADGVIWTQPEDAHVWLDQQTLAKIVSKPLVAHSYEWYGAPLEYVMSLRTLYSGFELLSLPAQYWMLGAQDPRQPREARTPLREPKTKLAVSNAVWKLLHEPGEGKGLPAPASQKEGKAAQDNVLNNLEMVSLCAFVAACATWKIHKERVQSTVTAWKNLVWNFLDLVIFAAWTSMYLGNVDSKDRLSFLGICTLVNGTGMWVCAGGLAQACTELQKSMFDRVFESVILVLMPLTSLLPLALATSGASGVAIAVVLVLAHSFHDLLSQELLRALHRRCRNGDVFMWGHAFQCLVELWAWRSLAGRPWAFVLMMMVGQVATLLMMMGHISLKFQCLQTLRWFSRPRQTVAYGIVRTAALAQQQLYFGNIVVKDNGIAAGWTFQFLVAMATGMFGMVVLRMVIGVQISQAWRVAHRQRAARRKAWCRSKQILLDDHQLKFETCSVRFVTTRSDQLKLENVDCWSKADLLRKMQDKEAKRHLVSELLYDFSQVAVMSWVESNISLIRSDFPGKLAVDFLNWMSTGVDILMLKGPKAFVKSGLPPNPVVDMVIEAMEDAEAAEDLE